MSFSRETTKKFHLINVCMIHNVFFSSEIALMCQGCHYKVPQTGGLNIMNILFHKSGRKTSKIKVSTGLVPYEDSDREFVPAFLPNFCQCANNVYSSLASRSNTPIPRSPNLWLHLHLAFSLGVCYLETSLFYKDISCIVLWLS